MKHILRYGTHAESKYFLLDDLSNAYDTVIFNGNMVAYTPAAIAGFIVSIQGKPFIIDPQTHAFQHDVYKLAQEDENGKLIPKKSIQKLAERFGNPVKEMLGKQSVLPEDFSDPSVKTEFCKNVIHFQQDIVGEYIQKGPFWKYLKFALETGHLGEQIFKPSGVVPPYFFMTNNTMDDWLPINKEFIEIANKEFPDQNIYAQLVISKDLLSSEVKLDKIIEIYKALPCSHVLLWVDDFDENSVGEELLNDFIKLCKGLSENKKIINLYGGYFSVLLIKEGVLSGVCHGLEYGESRGVVPVGGGIPMAKYYFYPLHQRMRYPDFLKIFIQQGWNKNIDGFKSNICNEACCEDGNIAKYGTTKPVKYKRGGQLISLNYPVPEAKDYSLRHYLKSKKREFYEVETKNKNILLSDLEKAFDEYKRILGLEEVGHVKIWKGLIEKM